MNPDTNDGEWTDVQKKGTKKKVVPNQRGDRGRGPYKNNKKSFSKPNGDRKGRPYAKIAAKTATEEAPAVPTMAAKPVSAQKFPSKKRTEGQSYRDMLKQGNEVEEAKPAEVDPIPQPEVLGAKSEDLAADYEVIEKPVEQEEGNTKADYGSAPAVNKTPINLHEIEKDIPEQKEEAPKVQKTEKKERKVIFPKSFVKFLKEKPTYVFGIDIADDVTQTPEVQLEGILEHNGYKVVKIDAWKREQEKLEVAIKRSHQLESELSQEKKMNHSLKEDLSRNKEKLRTLEQLKESLETSVNDHKHRNQTLEEKVSHLQESERELKETHRRESEKMKDLQMAPPSQPTQPPTAPQHVPQGHQPYPMYPPGAYYPPVPNVYYGGVSPSPRNFYDNAQPSSLQHGAPRSSQGPGPAPDMYDEFRRSPAMDTQRRDDVPGVVPRPPPGYDGAGPGQGNNWNAPQQGPYNAGHPNFFFQPPGMYPQRPNGGWGNQR
eukprot:maker-scaffold_5-snap-gene-10.62-mRNA-1 protein AED:0.01 eAED:0.01 QI:533/1/1/1/0.5/0.33/3/422/487